MFNSDDSPIQGGLSNNATALTGQSPHFSSVGLREMVVIDVVYADQAGNRSQSYPEYTVRDLQTGEKIPGVRKLNDLSDPDNGEEVVIHPARNLLPTAKPQKFTKSTPAIVTDGTRVLVGFIEGSHSRAVIIGVFAHPSASYGARAADGERRLITHRGTSVEFRQDGSYVIKRDATSVTLDSDANITVKHKSGSTLIFNADGSITVVPATGQVIKLGSDSIVAPLDGVVHGSGIDTFTGKPYAILGNASSVVLAKKI